MSDLRKMQVGQVIDFVIAWNERQNDATKRAEKEEQTGRRRKATQNDINSFFG